MNVSPLQSRVEASDVPMERLAGNSSLTEDQKIGEATRQFEAVLLRQILASTQKTVIQSKYTDNSTASGIYRDLVTNQLSDSISKSGSVGLAQTLKTEFTRQNHSKSPATDSQKSGAQSTAHAGMNVSKTEERPRYATLLTAPDAPHKGAYLLMCHERSFAKSH
jgi:peptidoglycan hydrolase FlgJ